MNFIVDEAPDEWQQDVLAMLMHYKVPHTTSLLVNCPSKSIYILNTQMHGPYWGEHNKPFDFLQFLSSDMLHALRTKQVTLCLDASNRPFGPRHWMDKDLNFRHHFRDYGVELTNLGILTCDMYEKQSWVGKGILTFLPYSVSADYVRARAYASFDVLPRPDLVHTRSHKFLCLMNYPHHHRVLMMLELLENNLDRFGLIGFCNGKVSKPSRKICGQILGKYNMGKALRNWDRLAETWAPDNFDIHHGNDCWITAKNYLDSYFNITVETFWEEQIPYYTEKIIKPVVMRQPFVLLGSAGTLAAFRTRGFQTFHPYIDESYDLEANPVNRFQMVLEEIKKLCAMSLPELHRWYHGPIKEIVEANFQAYMDVTTSPLHAHFGPSCTL